MDHSRRQRQQWTLSLYLLPLLKDVHNCLCSKVLKVYSKYFCLRPFSSRNVDYWLCPMKRCKATSFLTEHKMISYLADSEGGENWLDRECREIFQLSLSSDTTAGKCLLRCANWQESQKEKTGIFYYAFHLLLNVHLCSFAVWRSLAIANGFATLASEKVSHPVIEINGFLQF